MSGDDKVTKLLRTYLWEIQREKRGDIYRERGNIEILKINIEHHTPHNATHLLDSFVALLYALFPWRNKA